jgi:hypothetical protein
MTAGKTRCRSPQSGTRERRREVPINDRPLCEDPFYVGVAKSQVCPGADIASLAAGDHKGQVCDAVSTTLRFEGGSAKLGKIFRPDVPDAACPTFDPSCD